MGDVCVFVRGGGVMGKCGCVCLCMQLPDLFLCLYRNPTTFTHLHT